MIYTSYYANWRKFPDSALKVQISRTRPDARNVDCSQYIRIPMLMPAQELLDLYKAESITESEYKPRYLKQLKEGILTTNGQAVLETVKQMYDNKEKTYLFLCYEGKNSFCHRRLFADWFNSKYKTNIREL